MSNQGYGRDVPHFRLISELENTYNPCYVCHQDKLPERENVMNDADLQEAYSFSELGETNHQWA